MQLFGSDSIDESFENELDRIYFDDLFDKENENINRNRNRMEKKSLRKKKFKFIVTFIVEKQSLRLFNRSFVSFTLLALKLVRTLSMKLLIGIMVRPAISNPIIDE